MPAPRFHRYASTEQDDVLACDRPEYLLGKLHGGIRCGQEMGAERCLFADAPANRERLAQHSLRYLSSGAVIPRLLPG